MVIIGMEIKINKIYYDTGELKIKTYHREDDLYYWHNTGGSARIEYHKNGLKKYEAYYQNDLPHRIDGPSDILYSKSGRIVRVDWWIYGKQIKPTNLMKILWKRSQNEK